MMMSINQLHGKKFEDTIKSVFPGASDTKRSITAGFDIEAKFDKERGLPTLIKVTGNNIIGLADARSFWKIDDSIRLLVGHYSQDKDMKVFHTIYEFFLDKNLLENLKAEVPLNVIANFHDGLSLKNFPKGQYINARQWAQAEKTKIETLYPHCKITFNPKIDSKTQRRLQCSVKLKTLIEICANKMLEESVSTYIKHVENYKDIGLPLRLKSSKREFQKT